MKKEVNIDVLSTENQAYKDFNLNEAMQDYALYKKHIYEFKRTVEPIPDVFCLIFKYFEENEELIQKEGIFRRAGDEEVIDKLFTQIGKGNYEVVKDCNDPYTMATFLKRVLKEMGEPLCTFKLYSEFRDVNMLPQDQQLGKVKDICKKLPEVNRSVLHELLKFLRKVSQFKEQNTMNTYNLATVFYPNMFRPFELSQTELIYGIQIVKTL